MKRLSCTFSGLVVLALLNGAQVDCSDLDVGSKDASRLSDPASQGSGQVQDVGQERSALMARIADYAGGMKTYLNDGGDPNKIEEEIGIGGNQYLSLIVSAARNGSPEAVVRLICANADVNARAKSSQEGEIDALHAAIEGRTPEVAGLLLQTDIDRNAKDSNGRTPLMRLLSDHDYGKPSSFQLEVSRRLWTLAEGRSAHSTRWIDECCKFVCCHIRSCDLLELMRGVKDEEEIFTRVQGEIFKRIPPEKLNSFCEQVEDENVNTMNLLRGFLLPPATDYKEDILRMLLADGQVDLAAQDNDGNTALHLITQNAFFGYPFYRCIGRKYLQLLWDECIQRNFDFAITNHAGKSAQKLIDRVQRCIEIEDNTSFIPRYLALRRAVRQICSTAVYCGFTFVVSSLLSNLYDAVVGPVYARADQAAACWLGRAVYGLGKAVLTFGVMGATTPVYNALSEIIQRVMWRKNLIRCLEQ